MSSPIYHEWAASQPARSTPAPRHGNPLLSVLATAVLIAVAVRSWHEIEPRVAYRQTQAVVQAAGGAQVVFRYEVDGRSYLGAQRSPAATVHRQGTGAVPVQPYTPGTTVTAWFNPWHPAEAVLLRSPDSRLLAWMLALAVIAALMLLVARPPRIEPASDAKPETERVARSA